VKKRLACWTFLLFRSRTRQRYRAEFEDLLDEVIASGERAWRLWLDIALAAARDRLFGLRRSGRAGLAGTIVLAAVVGLATWIAVALSPATPIIGSTPHPIDLPTGPVTSAKDCPNPPKLSAPLPPGGTISPPSLVPASAQGSLTVAGHTYKMTGTCQYTVTVPQG
jgi:hypothetical protein